MADLEDTVVEISRSLSSIVTKLDYITRDVSSLCTWREDAWRETEEIKSDLASIKKDSELAAAIRKENRDRIASLTEKVSGLTEKVAVLETKADYAKNTCDGLLSTIDKIKEITWKQIGYTAGISGAIYIALWVVSIVFHV